LENFSQLCGAVYSQTMREARRNKETEKPNPYFPIGQDFSLNHADDNYLGHSGACRSKSCGVNGFLFLSLKSREGDLISGTARSMPYSF
jgi:hypothetical protein